MRHVGNRKSQGSRRADMHGDEVPQNDAGIVKSSAPRRRNARQAQSCVARMQRTQKKPTKQQNRRRSWTLVKNVRQCDGKISGAMAIVAGYLFIASSASSSRAVHSRRYGNNTGRRIHSSPYQIVMLFLALPSPRYFSCPSSRSQELIFIIFSSRISGAVSSS